MAASGRWGSGASVAQRVINGRGPAWRRATGMFWEGVCAAGGQEEFQGVCLVSALEPPEGHRIIGDMQRSSGSNPKDAPWEICMGWSHTQKSRGLLGACPWVISYAFWQFAQCWGPSSAGKPISPLGAAPQLTPSPAACSQLGAGCRRLAPFPAVTAAPCCLLCFGGTGTPRRDSSCGAGTRKEPGTLSPGSF